MISLCTVMSSSDNTTTVMECLNAGVEEYLRKPVTKREVQGLWKHVWRRVQNLRRVTEGNVQNVVMVDLLQFDYIWLLIWIL